MSEHNAKVYRVHLTSHSNANNLVLANPIGTAWQCIVRREDFNEGDLAAYIPIGTQVKPSKEFEFLAPRKYRIKTIKLRGEISQGLLIPARSGWKEGQDVTKELGVSRYEKPEPGQIAYKKNIWYRIKKWGKRFLGMTPTEPNWFKEYTDIENFKNFPHVFEEGEEVVITEKIDGTNFRVGYDGINDKRDFLRGLSGLKSDQFFAGSHYMLKDSKGDTIWAKLARTYELEAKFKRHFKGHRIVIFAEIYGRGIPNGCRKLWYSDEPGAAIFRIKFDDQWVNWQKVQEISNLLGVETVPVLYEGRFNRENLSKLTDGPSVLGKGIHIREGIVISAKEPQVSPRLPGQVKCLKSVSSEYLLLKGVQEDKEGT